MLTKKKAIFTKKSQERLQGIESSLKGHNQMAKNTEQAPEETKAWETSPKNQELACSGNNKQT